MKRTFAALATLAVTAVVAPGAPASAANGFLQPGDYMVAGSSACTTNFVFDGTGTKAGKVYIGTAAHCVSSIGQDVMESNGTTWGDVAMIGDGGHAIPDYALIEVRSAHVSRVRAAVKGYPQYPTGVTATSDTTAGDLVQISGHGLGFGFTVPTQEKRVGVFVGDTEDQYNIVGPIIYGDSGGPIVHIPTGKALGIVSRLCTGSACTETGPTVQGFIKGAAVRGFPITLRTVTPPA